MMREPRTHDYRRGRRGWGHDIHYTPLNGDRLRAGGWGEGIHPGDFLLLTNGTADTRYRVGKDFRRPAFGPGDQWFATLHFAPREVAA